MKLHIAPNFALPAEAVTQTFAILGIRGSGKTNTGVVLAEELLTAKQQVVIVDPVDVWWGLKSGFPVPVIGGDHADIPLEGAAGQVLADFVAETRASVILSLRHLSMNDQRRFAGDFAKRLYERKGQQRSPLMLIVDEADEFVPQRLPHGHEAMFGAFDRLVRRGRSSGIGVTLISQRAQVINKDVLSQMETLVGMRVLHKLDRKALEAWIEAHDTQELKEDFLSSLASLGRGDAWVWSPSWLNAFERIHVRARNTFDSSATPKAGEKIAPPKELEPVDLEKLRASMADTIQKAEADDPRKLRARIRELEAEARKAGPPVEDIVSANERGYRDGYKAGISAENRRMAALVSSTIEAVRTACSHLADRTPATSETPPPSVLPARISPPAAPTPLRRGPTVVIPPGETRTVAKVRTRSDASSNHHAGGPAAQRILDALAELEALGVNPAPRVQVAFMAGYTNLASKGFANAIGALRSAGNIDYPATGAIALTDSGRALAQASDAPRTSQELQDRLISMLGGANGRIVRALVAVYPKSLAREVLAERAGYTNTASKGFANAIGRLRSLGFIGYPQTGQVRAEDVLFLEGR